MLRTFQMPLVSVIRTQSVQLSSVGDKSSQFKDVLKEATIFFTERYKLTTDGSDVSSLRWEVWASMAHRVGKATSFAP